MRELTLVLIHFLCSASLGNGVPPPKTEGERRSPAFPHNLTTAHTRVLPFRLIPFRLFPRVNKETDWLIDWLIRD